MAQKTITLVVDDEQGSLAEFSAALADGDRRLCVLEDASGLLGGAVADLTHKLDLLETRFSALNAKVNDAADALAR